MKSGKCIYNKRALKHFNNAVCYFCLSSFDRADLLESEIDYRKDDDEAAEEEINCPMCGHDSVIPILNDDMLTLNWVGSMTSYFFDFSKSEQ